MFKYLEIAKKTMSGKLGNNLLELEFPLSEEENLGKQQFLMGLKSSALKNDDLVNRFYELVIENFEYTGNYLILLFHDAYDVIKKSSDNAELDESEEVYEYLLCAICPIILTKPGLGYKEEEQKIASRIRDWVVDVPVTGFIFPAFTDRSTDIHSLLFYNKDTKEPHNEFIAGGFGCITKKTGTEQKMIFKDLVINEASDEEDKGEDIFYDIQENINYILEEEALIDDGSKEPLLITKEKLASIMDDAGVPEEISQKIEEAYVEEFEDEPVMAEFILDSKGLADNVQKKREQGLVKEVCELKQQLSDMSLKVNEEIKDKDIDLIVKVKPEKVEMIKKQLVDGKMCVVIPLEDDENLVINGELNK